MPLAVFPPPRETKSLKLRWQLEVPGGAALSSLMALTGWQAHTIRAALSGLRKTGWVITRRREGSETIYAIDVKATVVKEETDEVAAIEDEPSPRDWQTDSAGSASAPDVGE